MIIQVKLHNMALILPPIVDFVKDNEASHSSLLCALSIIPIVFPKVLTSIITELNILCIARLMEKSRKMKRSF